MSKLLRIVINKGGKEEKLTTIYANEVPRKGEHIQVENKKYLIEDIVRQYPLDSSIDVHVKE